MKKHFCLILTALLLLSIFRINASAESGLLVIDTETPWAVIENNGAVVHPGDSVTFRITAEEGFSLTGTDYRGDT